MDKANKESTLGSFFNSCLSPAEKKQKQEQELLLLRAQVGNLEVQNADYQQIVKELSDKLKLYENKHGTVFRPSRNTSDQK
jgi:hypothetical protein|tara:strand:+ start:475 stop:717 length:243 start_codon:yes stop_codon:yes gene_type:complete